MSKKSDLAVEIYESLNNNGAGLGDASISIIWQALERSDNSDYVKCANYLIGMFDWLQEKVTEQDIVNVLKKYFG